LYVDKELLDFGVIVAGSNKFEFEARVAPSERAPPREMGEPQAWISVKDELLDKVLLQLKSVVHGNIHQRPSITKVLLPAGI
jgi:hypothetical protein